MKNENVNLIRLRCIENVLFSDIVITVEYSSVACPGF